MRKTALATILALALLAAAGALAAARFTDSAGDSGVAPDITAVAVTHDTSGNLTIRVTTDDVNLKDQSVMTVFFDTDGNNATGGDGVEYYLIYGATGGIFYRWNGTRYVEADTPTLDASYASNELRLKINKSDLHVVDDFSFYVVSQQYDLSGAVIATDHAPNGTGEYDYSLVAPEPLALRASAPTAVPAGPVAGKPFTVRVNVTRTDTEMRVGTGTVTCRATVALKPLRATGRFSAGRATCAMTVPRSAHGKRIRGTIKVTFRGASVTKAFTYRVP